MCCRTKWNSNIFLQRKLFQRKKVKNEPKGHMNSLRLTNLSLDHQKAKRLNNFF